MSEETIEGRIALLEKAERRNQEFRSDVCTHYDNHLRDMRHFKAFTNVVISVAILLSIIAAPFTTFQCWKLWNGYGVVVIEMNRTAQCDQCKQERQNGNGK